jgi:hypothetical protein
MENMQYSLSTLNDVIAQKLRSLASVTSARDIKEINSFLRESQRLRKTLYSISDIEEYEDQSDSEIEGPENLDYMGILIQACEYIKNFHTVVDFKKVKETKAQWLLNESAEFLTELRGAFGGRIPVMPGSIEGRADEIESGEPAGCPNPKKCK